MFFISYFFLAIAEVLDILLTLFMWAIIIRALLSWINPDPLNPIVKIIRNLTEPAINLLRSKIPTIYGGIDISTVILFLFIIFLRTFVVNVITQTARSLI